MRLRPIGSKANSHIRSPTTGAARDSARCLWLTSSKIWHQKRYRQIQGQLWQLKTGDHTLHAEQTKEAAMAENVHRIGESAIDELNGHRSVRREPKEFRFVDDQPHHFARSTVHADRMV